MTEPDTRPPAPARPARETAAAPAANASASDGPDHPTTGGASARPGGAGEDRPSRGRRADRFGPTAPLSAPAHRRRYGLETYLNLVYLIPLFSQPIFTPDASWLLWASALASLAIFLPLYFRSYGAPAPVRLRSAGLMTALAFATALVNTGGAIYYVYAGALVGTALRGRRLVATVAGLAALNVAQGLLVVFVIYRSPWAGITFGFTLVFVLVISAMTRAEAERGRANARLRLAQDEVERLARIAERERIARDLHDLLGHSLSVVALKAELARKLSERDPARAAGEIADVERIARQALSEMRGAVRGYRAAGLAGELANARLALEAAGVEATFEVEPLRLDPAREGVLALALREAVTNVVRHAGARRLVVTLARREGSAHLTVADDGVGGDAPAGAGLSGMRERLAAVGGTLTRRGGAEGTTLCASVPLPADEGGGEGEARARGDGDAEHDAAHDGDDARGGRGARGGGSAP